MLIRPYSNIPVGTQLTVELKQGESIKGTARWVDHNSVGVEFDEPVDARSLIAPPADAPAPRMPRIEVECFAIVREGARVVRTRVVNVSQGGLRIECDNGLRIGADVIVTLAGLPPERGVVRWSDGKDHGLVFNRVLSISQLVAWLQSQQQRAAAQVR
jgi:hypothetical protein